MGLDKDRWGDILHGNASNVKKLLHCYDDLFNLRHLNLNNKLYFRARPMTKRNDPRGAYTKLFIRTDGWVSWLEMCYTPTAAACNMRCVE